MNHAPEPDHIDIERAAVVTAERVFKESDAGLTVAYYRRLCAIGPVGVIAMNLFRASKTSSRAKVYRGRHYREASYGIKNYSLSELYKALAAIGELCWNCGRRAADHNEHLLCPSQKSLFNNSRSWGWKRDPKTRDYEWVLYVDIPTGQASFHSPTRGDGPDYAGAWNPGEGSTAAVLAFCEQLSAAARLQELRVRKALGAWDGPNE